MVGQAYAFIEQAREADLKVEYLVRDREGMYVREFDQVFKDIGCRVKQIIPQTPNQNIFIEPWVKSIKFETLKFSVVFGKKHFDYLVSSCKIYYNTVRPHQALDNRPLTGNWPRS